MNTAVFAASDFASKLLTFMMLPLYTSYMNATEFGVGDLVQTTVSLILPISTLCIYSAVLRFVLESKEKLEQKFSIGLKLTLLSILILCALYPILSRLKPLSEYLPLLYMTYAVYAFDKLMDNFARGMGRIKLIGITGVFKTLVVVLCNVIFLAVFRMGISGYLLSFIIGISLAVMIRFYALRAWRYVSFVRTDKELLHSMVSYSAPLAPNEVSWWLNNSANKYIITYFCNVGMLGIYAASARFPAILAAVQGILSQALTLFILDEYKESSKKSNQYDEIYKYYNITMVFACSLLIFFTRPMTRVMLSAEFHEAWKYVPFLLISSLFGAISGYLGTFYVATKKTKGMFLTTLYGGILSILLNVLLIPLWGIMGAAVSAMLSYFLVWIIRLYDIQKYVVLQVDLWRDFRAYTLLLIQAIVYLLTENLWQYAVCAGCLCGLLAVYHNEVRTIWGAVMRVARSFIRGRSRRQ